MIKVSIKPVGSGCNPHVGAEEAVTVVQHKADHHIGFRFAEVSGKSGAFSSQKRWDVGQWGHFRPATLNRKTLMGQGVDHG